MYHCLNQDAFFFNLLFIYLTRFMFCLVAKILQAVYYGTWKPIIHLDPYVLVVRTLHSDGIIKREISEINRVLCTLHQAGTKRNSAACINDAKQTRCTYSWLFCTIYAAFIRRAMQGTKTLSNPATEISPDAVCIFSTILITSRCTNSACAIQH